MAKVKGDEKVDGVNEDGFLVSEIILGCLFQLL